MQLPKRTGFQCLLSPTNTNILELNELWCKVTKSAVGAVFNVQNAILEVILGIPPLLVTNRILSVKHYLKVFSSVNIDVHHDFMCREETQKFWARCGMC